MSAPPAPVDARYNYGPSILDGELQYASPSSLDLGDTRTEGGCLRKWYFERVEKRKPPQGTGQATGTACHAEIEHYLKTGEDVLGTIVRRGKHMIPEPGRDLRVEWALCEPPPGYDPTPQCPTCGARSPLPLVARPCTHPAEAYKAPPIDPRRSPVHIAGVPVIGYLDLAHARGTNQGADDIREAYDPPGTVEVLDWKFLADPERYAKSHDAVASATPMLIYGRALATVLGNEVEHARLSHGYFGTRERVAFKRGRRVSLDVIDQRLEPVATVMRDIVDVARQTSADDVPGNTRACHAFRGCPHREYCSAGQRGSLAKFFGTAANPIKDPTMSVLNNILPGAMPGFASQPAPAPVAQPAPQTVAPPAAVSPPSPSPVVPPAGVGVALHLSPQFAPRNTAAVPPGFAEALRDIHDAGFGSPAYGLGGAAQAVAAIKGIVLEGQGYAASGHLGTQGVTCMTTDDVLRIAAELRPYAERNRAAAAAYPVAPSTAPAAPVHAAERAAAHVTPPGMPAILPPDAPASHPILNALPVQPQPGDSPAAVAAMQAHAAQYAAMQTADAGAQPAAAAPMPVETTPAKAKRAPRAKKGDAEGRKGGHTSHNEDVAAFDGVVLLVDASVDSGATNLAPYVQAWCDDIVKALGGASCVDIRCAPETSSIGYSKWKGALAAHVREQFDLGAIASGTWTLDARGSEIGEVVAEALRTKVDFYARGR